jgi:hypothetical protein
LRSYSASFPNNKAPAAAGRVRVALLVCASVATALFAPPALAKDERESDRIEQAESYRKEGFKYFAAGRFLDGIAELERANALVPHPDFLLNIAIAYTKVGGHCQEALETLERFVVACRDCPTLPVGRARQAELRQQCETSVILEAKPPAPIRIDQSALALTPPIELKLAHGQHRVALDATEGEVQTSIHVVAPLRRLVFRLDAQRAPAQLILRGSPATTRLSVDGAIVQAVGGSYSLSPGNHAIEVSTPGSPPTRFELVATQGQIMEIDESRELAAARPPPHAVEPASSTLRPWAWVSLGAGVAGAAVGGVFTGLTFGDLSRTHGAAPADFDAANADAHRHYVGAAAGFGGAALGAALATILFVLSSDAPAPAGDGS